MASQSGLYQKLMRLREKRARLQRRITLLENKLAGKKARWGNCSYQRKRT